jgi:hypothetical protein
MKGKRVELPFIHTSTMSRVFQQHNGKVDKDITEGFVYNSPDKFITKFYKTGKDKKPKVVRMKLPKNFSEGNKKDYRKTPYFRENKSRRKRAKLGKRKTEKVKIE